MLMDKLESWPAMALCVAPVTVVAGRASLSRHAGWGSWLICPSLPSPADDSPSRGPLQPVEPWTVEAPLLDLDWAVLAVLAVLAVRLSAWSSGLADLSDCLTFWRKYPYPLIRPSQAWSPETSRLSARLMFDQPTGPHVPVISICQTATAQVITARLPKYLSVWLTDC